MCNKCSINTSFHCCPSPKKHCEELKNIFPLSDKEWPPSNQSFLLCCALILPQVHKGQPGRDWSLLHWGLKFLLPLKRFSFRQSCGYVTSLNTHFPKEVSSSGVATPVIALRYWSVAPCLSGRWVRPLWMRPCFPGWEDSRCHPQGWGKKASPGDTVTGLPVCNHDRRDGVSGLQPSRGFRNSYFTSQELIWKEVKVQTIMCKETRDLKDVISTETAEGSTWKRRRRVIRCEAPATQAAYVFSSYGILTPLIKINLATIYWAWTPSPNWLTYVNSLPPHANSARDVLPILAPLTNRETGIQGGYTAQGHPASDHQGKDSSLAWSNLKSFYVPIWYFYVPI